MIGNKIRYTYYYPGTIGFKEVHEGVVVDAYTAVKGKVEGMNFVIFGEVSGGVDSKRIYIVEYVIGNKKFYEEIKSWQLIEILTNKLYEPTNTNGLNS